MLILRIDLRILLLGAILVSGVVAAQEPGHGTVVLPGDQSGLGPATLDEEGIARFAVAYHEVEKVRNQYRPLIDGAVNPTEKRRLQEDANRAMADAIVASGLEVDLYNRIARMTHTDVALRKRVRNIADHPAVIEAPAPDSTPAKNPK